MPCLIALFAVLAAGDGPRVTHLGAVAPDVLELVVRVGRSVHGVQQPYVAQQGDQVKVDGTNHYLVRDGRDAGTLVGPRRDVFTPFDRVVGTGREVEFGPPAIYALGSPDDPAYATPRPPVRVSRKTKPTDLARTAGWSFDSPVEHHLYLHLPSPLVGGKTYRLAIAALDVPFEFRFDPATLVSEAVHVTQIGFRPDDPFKAAYLSCWMGDGGGLSYPAGLAFRVIVQETGAVAFRGTAELAKAATATDEDAYGKNHNGADVWRLAFTGLTEPGTYRVVVDGIGCSPPFAIADDVWLRAFVVAARGFYHLRSGLELGPPHTDFRRPRNFRAEDGIRIFHSSCGLIDSANGLGREPTNFGNLVAGKTDAIVPDAWGGTHDAGDWDRRIQHLRATRALFELYELFPERFGRLDLNLPESANALPDVLDEGLWNLDCYRRMQTPEGGVRGGIESSEHPNIGEASWQETLTVMAYAPDVWSSYWYAGTAARAARILRPLAAGLADVYLESAVRAARWADEHLPERAGRNDSYLVHDERNLAAAELFRATGEPGWQALFAATTVFGNPAAPLEEWEKHDQREAAWVYAVTQQPGVDAALRANCRAAILREADERVLWTQRTGFGWTKSPWAPFAYGIALEPPAVVARAHRLTGDPKYLAALVSACQLGAGANPLNLCYTTGVGTRWPQNPLHLDSRHTGQPAPAGLTVFGPSHMPDQSTNFAYRLVAPHAYPALETWPTQDAFFDVFWWPSQCEFTVQDPMSDVAYVWGYLAGR